MPPNVRVIVSRGPGSPLVYHAEAYDDGDRFRERIWVCDHDHDTVEGALHCGNEWLREQGGEPVGAP